MTWGVFLLVSSHFAFSYCSWGSQGKNTEVVCHSLYSGPHSVRPLHHDPPILGCPTGMAWFHWARQGCGPKAREFQKNIYFCFIDHAKAFDSVDHNKLWKILKEMGIPDHLTCLLRNLYAGQEATVRTGHGTTNWFQIGKGVRQGCTVPAYLTSMQSTS